MRKLIIAAVVVVFAFYCIGVGERYTRRDVPQYEVETVDLLGGHTIQSWKSDPSEQLHRIQKLSAQKYQPVEPIQVNGSTLSPDQPLGLSELQSLVDKRLEAGKREDLILKLRNPAPILALASRRYRLRNPLPDLGYEGGEALNKAVIDRLIEAKHETVGIVGQGDPVNIQPGTMAMIILIFVGLVMALQDILWKPLLSLIDERQAEIEEGSVLVRQNRQRREEVEEEGVRLRAEARREYLAKLSQVRREAMVEADKIIKEAKIEAHKIREQGVTELHDEIEKARGTLQMETKDYARAMVEQVLGRKPAAS